MKLKKAVKVAVAPAKKPTKAAPPPEAKRRGRPRKEGSPLPGPDGKVRYGLRHVYELKELPEDVRGWLTSAVQSFEEEKALLKKRSDLLGKAYKAMKDSQSFKFPKKGELTIQLRANRYTLRQKPTGGQPL